MAQTDGRGALPVSYSNAEVVPLMVPTSVAEELRAAYVQDPDEEVVRDHLSMIIAAASLRSDLLLRLADA